MALAQADVVLAQLAAMPEGDARTAVHETRKAIKRLRTIVRLLEGQLGRPACSREQDALRAAAAMLAPRPRCRGAARHPRSADRATPGELAGRRGVVRLRLALAVRARGGRAAPARTRPAPPCRRRAARCSARGPALAARGAARGSAPSRRVCDASTGGDATRYRRAGRKRGRTDADDAPVAQAGQGSSLRRRSAASAKPQGARAPAPAPRRASDARWLHVLAQARGRARRTARRGARPGGPRRVARGARRSGGRRARATRRRLRKLIARRRRKLRRTALREARELYRRKPGRFVRRVPTGPYGGARRSSADADDRQPCACPAEASPRSDRRRARPSSATAIGDSADRQPVPRRGVVGADDPPGLLGALLVADHDGRAEPDDAGAAAARRRRRPRRRSFRAAARSSSRGAPGRSWRRGTRCSPSDRPIRGPS